MLLGFSLFEGSVNKLARVHEAAAYLRLRESVESDIAAQKTALAKISKEISIAREFASTVDLIVALNPAPRSKPTPPLNGKWRKRMHECFNCGAPNRGTECFYCGELPDPRWGQIEIGYPEPETRLELVAQLVQMGCLDAKAARHLLGIL